MRAGATVKGHIDIDSGGVHGTGTVTITIAGATVATQQVALDGGHVDVPFTYALPPSVTPGVVSVDAKLAVNGPTPIPGNDATSSRMVVERPPHVGRSSTATKAAPIR